jgi:hypothetical protein
VTSADFAVAKQAVVTEALRWPWSKSLPPPEHQRHFEQQIRESPSEAIDRITRNPDFFNDLSKVQSAITSASWIEILGCQAGKDKDYLKAIQHFFGGTATPKVTAPDWFQFWGHFGYTAVDDTVEEGKNQWKKKGVKDALEYWYRPITGNKRPKKLTHAVLLDYLRQGHVLPLARPGTSGEGRLLMLKKNAPDSFLAWLSRHSYQLTVTADIQKQVFTGMDFGQNVELSVVDWLQEKFTGPTQIIFRPSPAYNQHIIKV